MVMTACLYLLPYGRPGQGQGGAISQMPQAPLSPRSLHIILRSVVERE